MLINIKQPLLRYLIFDTVVIFFNCKETLWTPCNISLANINRANWYEHDKLDPVVILLIFADSRHVTYECPPHSIIGHVGPYYAQTFIALPQPSRHSGKTILIRDKLLSPFFRRL